MLGIGVDTIARHLADVAVLGILLFPLDLRRFLEAQRGQRLARFGAKRLLPLGCVDLGESNPVLTFLCVLNGQRVSIHHADHRARERFCLNAWGQNSQTKEQATHRVKAMRSILQRL